MNRLFFMRQLLYRLKRDYGSPVDIYYEAADAVDLTTGKRSITKEMWSVRRGITLPTSIHRDSVYAAALKSEFQYGSVVQFGDKTVILDRRDLPRGFKLGEENWYMILGGHRYEVRRVEEYEDETAYFVVLKETKGAPLESVRRGLRPATGSVSTSPDR